MSQEKFILVVDDHSDTRKFLKDMLTMSDTRYKVTSVRSAEEAETELRRAYDLLITDLYLPGRSGVDLARRVKSRFKDMPIIAVSGFSKELLKAEQSEVGFFSYFRKPIITDEMLESVHLALWGKPLKPPTPPAVVAPPPPPPPTAVKTATTPAVAKTPAAPPPPSQPKPAAIQTELQIIVEATVPDEAKKNIENLRFNTGADHIVLGTIDGKLACDYGVLNLAWAEVVPNIAKNVHASFALGDQLGTEDHQTILYQTSKQYDIYTANIGEYHFLTMFFDAQAKRGRIGTVWVFIQRAIKDLQPLLANTKIHRVEVPLHKPATEEIQRTIQQMPHAAAVSLAELEAEAEIKPSKPVEAPAVYVPPPAVELTPLTDKEMAKLKKLDPNSLEKDTDAEQFWETAVSSTPPVEPAVGTGFTLEEARKSGLISNLPELAPAENIPAFLRQGSPPAEPEMTLDLGPAEANEIDLGGLFTPPTGLAPAENIPDFLKTAGQPAEPTLTLDLGGGDDFDLSGMPGLGSAPAVNTPALDLSDEGDFDLSGMPGLGTAPAANTPAIDLSDEGDFDLSGMPGLETTPAAPPPTASGKPQATQADIDAFWNAIVFGDTNKTESEDGLGLEEAMRLGLENELDTAGNESQTAGEGLGSLANLDFNAPLDEAEEFWEAAVEKTDPAVSTGLSWEEAIKKGLIPGNLNN